jgi:hypothetical protein
MLFETYYFATTMSIVLDSIKRYTHDDNYFFTPQDSDEWLTARRMMAMFTGSQIAAMVLPGRLSFKTRYDAIKELYAERKKVQESKQLLKNEVSSIPPLRHGTIHETFALESALADLYRLYANKLRYNFKKFHYTTHGLKLHDTIPSIGGSVDGILHTEGEDFVLEVKCPYYNEQIPHQEIAWKYLIQLEVNCRVWDLKRAIFISASINSFEKCYQGARVYIYTRSDALWDEIVRRCAYVKETYIDKNELPPKVFRASKNKDAQECPMSDELLDSMKLEIDLLFDTYSNEK